MQIQNKTLNKQSPKLFHVNNFEKHISVTSFLNTSKKTLNNENDAFALMPNKSLKNRYAITGLQTDIYKPSFRCDITSWWVSYKSVLRRSKE